MTEQPRQFTISSELEGKRLDLSIAQALDMTRSQAKRYIDRERVRINGDKPKKSGEIMVLGQEITVLPFLTEKEEEVEADTSIYAEIQIISETDEYIVLHKPSGLLVHPTEKQQPVSLANWLLEQYPGLKGVGEYDNRPGIMHRLDKDASGVMVIAKTQESFMNLKQQFKDRKTYKEYKVLVHGEVDQVGQGEIDFAIARGKEGRMAARPKVHGDGLQAVGKEQPGKPALTYFWVEKAFVNYSLLKVQIKTGRTHQIRVHMLAFNHPVVGDSVYTQKRYENAKGPGRLFLHAYKLGFTDQQGELKEFVAELPETLDTFLQQITPRV